MDAAAEAAAASAEAEAGRVALMVPVVGGAVLLACVPAASLVETPVTCPATAVVVI